jgi:hypothetical protein
MNGMSDGPEGLDPELTRMFDAARAPLAEEAFVRATLLELRKARRAWLARRSAILAIALVLSAWVAPYVAQATLLAAGWLSERLPGAGLALVSPLGCVCAALIAWRVARRVAY